jgi:putative ABC transport system permease protein
MRADHLVFQSGVRLYLHRSILPMTTLDQVRQVPGVSDAAPLGHLTITTRRADSQSQIDATILAIDPSSFLAPKLIGGHGLDPDTANAVVVDDSFKRYGVKLNDQLYITPANQPMTVEGINTGQKYNHLPVIFTTIPFWQSVKFAAPGSSGGVANPISAVAVQSTGDAAARIAASVPGVEVATREVALHNLPGYSEENGTITMMLAFLFVIAAFVLAVFFYVLTLQKTTQFGVLKAIGASTGFLVRDLIGQVMLLTLVGVAVGVILTFAVAAVVPANLPFALSNNLIVTYALVMLLVGLVGTLLSLRRISGIDPLLAIGRTE